MLKNCSLPAPRTHPVIMRPREIKSISASSSAIRSGCLITGSGLPMSRMSRLLRQPRQDSRLDVHHAAHAERVAVMLVQADDVEAEFLGVQVLVDEVVIVFGRALAIEVAIRDGEVSAVAQYHIFGNPSRRPFGEIPYLHSYLALDY